MHQAAVTSRKELGKQGENVAAEFLVQHGYEIVERNVPFKEGEIDIIAEKDGELCFIEVKTRRTQAFGVEESVSPRKLRRLRLAAARWLEGRPWADVRFDVIGVLVAEGMPPQVRHTRGIDRGAR